MTDDIVARLRMYANASIEGEWSSVFRADLNIAADEIERLRELSGDAGRLREEVERLRAERDGYLEGNRQTLAALAEANEIAKRYKAERDALWRLTDRLFAEHDALRAERDEVRQSYCSLMEAYRGGDGKVTANKLGWGYLFEEDKPCQ